MANTFRAYPHNIYLNDVVTIVARGSFVIKHYFNGEVVESIDVAQDEPTLMTSSFKNAGIHKLIGGDGCEEIINVDDAYRLGSSVLDKSFVFEDPDIVFLVLKDRMSIFDISSQSYVYKENGLCPDEINKIDSDLFLFKSVRHNDEYGESTSLSIFSLQNFSIIGNVTCDGVLHRTEDAIFLRKGNKCIMCDLKNLSMIWESTLSGEIWYKDRFVFLVDKTSDAVEALDVLDKKSAVLQQNNLVSVTEWGCIISKTGNDFYFTDIRYRVHNEVNEDIPFLSFPQDIDVHFRDKVVIRNYSNEREAYKRHKQKAEDSKEAGIVSSYKEWTIEIILSDYPNRQIDYKITKEEISGRSSIDYGRFRWRSDAKRKSLCIVSHEGQNVLEINLDDDKNKLVDTVNKYYPKVLETRSNVHGVFCKLYTTARISDQEQKKYGVISIPVPQGISLFFKKTEAGTILEYKKPVNIGVPAPQREDGIVKRSILDIESSIFRETLISEKTRIANGYLFCENSVTQGQIRGQIVPYIYVYKNGIEYFHFTGHLRNAYGSYVTAEYKLGKYIANEKQFVANPAGTIMALSNDLRFVLTPPTHGLRLWDTTKKTSIEIPFVEDSYTDGILSPDGSRLIYKKGGQYAFCDFENGKVEKFFDCRFIKYAEDGRMLFASSDGTRNARIMDPETFQFVDNSNYRYYQFVSPDGSLVAETSIKKKYYNKCENRYVESSEWVQLGNRLLKNPIDFSIVPTFYDYDLEEQSKIYRQYKSYFDVEYGYHEKYVKKLQEKVELFSARFGSTLDTNNIRLDSTEELEIQEEIAQKITVDSVIEEQSFFVISRRNGEHAIDIPIDNIQYLNYIAFSYDNKYVGIVGKYSSQVSGGYVKIFEIADEGDNLSFIRSIPIESKHSSTFYGRSFKMATWVCGFSKEGHFYTYDSTPITYEASLDNSDTQKPCFEISKTLNKRSWLCVSPSSKYIALSEQGYEAILAGGTGHQPSSSVFIYRTSDFKRVLTYSCGSNIESYSWNDKYKKNANMVSFSEDDSRFMVVRCDGVILIKNLHLEEDELDSKPKNA